MKPDKLYLRYGLLTAAGLIAYFLVLKLIGWHQHIWLRLLNGAIVAYGIYAVIRLRSVLEGSTFDYYKGFKTGIMSGFFATILFTIFMAIYMYHIDPEFPNTIINSWIKDYKQGPGILIFILLVEGFASSVILTLTFMQKIKPSWNTKKTTQKT